MTTEQVNKETTHCQCQCHEWWVDECGCEITEENSVTILVIPECYRSQVKNGFEARYAVERRVHSDCVPSLVEVDGEWLQVGSAAPNDSGMWVD